ncbi:hypothetical protein OJ997_26500 [Solirubrobacter phytolaccae]|uniref:Uncharacterized protein n=1 Tax=Solirubrobacter phytolaccae TaxID=1404360 RepID=A0A9X3NF78_9ACTN|nr:hypothetical protein [Solirubrobacter phytolaccae]MDA0183885.1 hypothetical protein [Solirubrobacter phytolaccae]
MLNARRTAHKHLIDSVDPPVPSFEEGDRATSTVVHYFEEVEILCVKRQVDVDLIAVLLGRYILNWHRYLSDAGELGLVPLEEYAIPAERLQQLAARAGAPARDTVVV